MTQAIFLGTFNPPHKGHEICLESVIDSEVMEKLGISEIHMIPACQNPNKTTTTKFVHRYDMCVKAINNNDKLRNKVVVDNIEAIIQPKYTYELIDRFLSGKDRYVSPEFWWIITEETFIELLDGRWKNSEELLNKNKFILLVDEEIFSEKVKEWVSKNVQRVEIIPLKQTLYVHSTNVRNAFKNNEEIPEDWLSPTVKDFINAHKFYE